MLLTVGTVGLMAGCAGADHSCAALAEGTVECWGANASTQLGNTSSTD